MQKGTGHPRVAAELLAMPAPHAVRAVALARLDEVRSAYDRFGEGDDEGLHDLRVALRRLRSWLRAFRPEVSDTLRRKTRRALSALAAATNGARDAEVGLEWIEAQEDMPRRTGAGRRCIVERLEHERDAATREVKETLARDLPKLMRKLSAQLGEYWERQRVDHIAPVPLMAPVLADALHNHMRRVVRAFGRIETVEDVDRMHRARIAVKRLRYLLEPLDGEAASPTLESLESVQQLLGDVHDAHRLSARLVREIGERAARDARRRAMSSLGIGDATVERPSFASVRPGLMELARRSHAAEGAAHARFEKSWGARDIARMSAEVEAIAAALPS